MQTFICTIYNAKTGHYCPPILFETKEKAIHQFTTELNAENSEMKLIEDSLKLFCIGRYEVTTGKIKPYIWKKLLWEKDQSFSYDKRPEQTQSITKE